MEITGHYYPAGSAAKSAARFYVEGDRYKLEFSDIGPVSGSLDSLEISDRVGNIERKLTLADGAVFASDDNDAIDQLFAKRNFFARLLRILETRMRWVTLSLLATILIAFSFFKFVVPWGSEQIAHALPQQTNELISTSTFKFLDKYVFTESKLDSEVKSKIRLSFQTKLLPLIDDADGTQYELHFRRWSQGGVEIPNALALPSGDIILTDEFVSLSLSQDEIDSVLLHEIGHVVHRHSLQSLIQASFVSAAVMLITSDGGFLFDAGAGLGSLLISSHFSRGHESEADIYALNKMLELGVDPVVFANILERISAEPGSENTERNRSPVDKTSDDIEHNPATEDKELLDYIASHPNTADRKKRTLQYQHCYEQGLLVCEAAD